MNKKLDYYLKLFLNLNDTIYYSILFLVLLFMLIYLIFKRVIIPLEKKHILENNALEMENAKLMALFAELDPDPILRIDLRGIIIFTNEAAKNLIKEGSLRGKPIQYVIPQLVLPIIDFILNDNSKSFSTNINSKNYLVLFRGISSLKIAQVYFHDITEKIENENKLKSMTDKIQNNTEVERQRIARELHDSVGQELLLLKMDLLNTQKSFPIDSKTNDYFSHSTKILQKIITELNVILFNLMPSTLRENGLGTAIVSMVNKITSTGFIKGSVNIVGLEERLNDKLEISIYRIIQEALNNIIKHAQAEEFSIQIILKDERVKILISDNGIGMSSNYEAGGFGLINIRERIEFFNGVFKVDSSQNGTLLVIDIPMVKKDA